MSEMVTPQQVTESLFYPLAGVNTTAATPSTISFENLKRNIKLGFPRLHQLTEFMKVKGRNKKIAIVGGGPSLKYHLDELRQFKTIFCCGSPNDFLMENGIIPTYAGICDPDPVGINYYKHLDTEVKYLIASSADEKIINHFKNHQLVLWHCHSDDYLSGEKPEENYQAVGGGCTIGLRAINIALLMGYNNFHLFGFDSCLEIKDNQVNPYVYPLSTDAEKEQGGIYPVRVGDENSPVSKIYYCVGYHLAQAEHFRLFCNNYFEYFTAQFYGDGILRNIYEVTMAEYKKNNPNWTQEFGELKNIFETRHKVD